MVKDVNYTNGVLDGYFVYYEYNGQKKKEGKYQMGKPRGVWKIYKNGKLSETKDYTLSNNPLKKNN